MKKNTHDSEDNRLIKTLSKAQKMEREKFRIPRSVQDAIPIRRIFRGWDFPSRQPVFQNMVVYRHQLRHRQQRGQNIHVP